MAQITRDLLKLSVLLFVKTVMCITVILVCIKKKKKKKHFIMYSVKN